MPVMPAMPMGLTTGLIGRIPLLMLIGVVPSDGPQDDMLILKGCVYVYMCICL